MDRSFSRNCREFALLMILYGLISVSCLRFSIKSPRNIRHNKEESVTVTVVQATPRQTISLHIQVVTISSSSSVFFSRKKRHVFSKDHHVFHIPVKISPTLKECQPPKSGHDQQLCKVKLLASATEMSVLLWSETVEVEVVKMPGRIYIQNDRPVYSPGDEVYIRFISVADDLMPLKQRAILTIKSPVEGGTPITSWRKKVSLGGVFVKKFLLPVNCPMGLWNISAVYTRQTIYPSVFRAAFAVDYKSLPSYEVFIKYKRDFILPQDDDFHMRLFARTFHGIPVAATAHVWFGLTSRGDSDFTNITHFINNLDMMNGEVALNISISRLVGFFSPLSLCGMHLLVVASVTRSGSGETRTTREDIVTFSSDPYVITFWNNRRTYKAGLPILANVGLKFPNDSIAEGVDVLFTITSVGNSSTQNVVDGFTAQTSPLGMAMMKFQAPTESLALNITVVVQHVAYNGHRYLTKSSKTLNLETTSSSSEYILVEEPKNRLRIGVSEIVELYSNPPEREKMVFYNVVKNGKILLSSTVTMHREDANILISIPVSANMSPAVVLNAYFYTEEGDIVEDGVILFVERVCVGEEPVVLTRRRSDEAPLPGTELLLEVSSEASAYVSMIGTDLAMRSVEDQYKNPWPLEREQVFDSQEILNQACTTDIADPPSKSSQSGQCTNNLTKRTRRSLMEEFGPNPVVNMATDGLQSVTMYDCCIVGSLDLSTVIHTPSETSCRERTKRLQREKDHECLIAFQECCELAECMRMEVDDPSVCFASKRFPEEPQGRSVSSPQSVSPFIDSMRSAFIAETPSAQAVTLLRRNFSPTWFFIDFEMDPSGNKVLSTGSRPSIPAIPDTITAWNVDIMSISQDSGLCIGKSLEIPVKLSTYLEVMVDNRPVTVGTQVSVEVTMYNHWNYRVKVEVVLEGAKGLCSKAKPGKDSDAVTYFMDPSSNNIPSTNNARFIVVPLISKDFIIKIKMTTWYDDSAKPATDVVEKTLVVIPEGNVKKKVDWILISARDASRRRDERRSRSFLLPTPTDAIPGTLKVQMSWYSLPSATMFTPDDGRPATIQEILYILHPTISKLEYSELSGTLTAEMRKFFIRTISDCYTALLAFVRVADHRQTAYGVLDGTYAAGLSYSPASNSKPYMKLTSSTLELLFRAAKVVQVDKELLQACLRWILSHQTPSGYFRTSISSTNTEKSNVRARKSAIYPGDRLFMTNLDRKIYLTSEVLLDLISIKESLDDLTSFQDDYNLTSHKYSLSHNIELGESYLENKLQMVSADSSCRSITSLAAASHVLYRLQRQEIDILVSALSKWTRSKGPNNFQDWTRWFETCSYNPTNVYMDPNIDKSNAIEAAAHALQQVNLQGYRNEGFANWIMYQRNIDGHWGSLRATLAAMQGLKSYHLIEYALEENSFPEVELVDSELRGKTISPAENFPIELNSARHKVAFTTRGMGMSWVKLETTYSLASVTSRPQETMKAMKISETSPTCPYKISISLSVHTESLTSRAARKRFAWDVLLNVNITTPQDTDSEYNSYIVDFGLPVGSTVFEIDLGKLFNPIEHIVDHYRLTERSVLLYMSGNKNVGFRITDTNIKLNPIPVEIYPITAPESSCTEFYNFPGLSAQPYTFCAGGAPKNTPCQCANGRNCPTVSKTKKSARLPLDKRLRLTCEKRSTFAYKVLLKQKLKFDDHWFRYEGQIETIFRLASGTMGIAVDQTHAFWVKTSCKNLGLKTSYLVIGHVVNPGNRGGYEHLLDGEAWMESWKPYSSRCEARKKLSNVCKAQFKMKEYEYTMARRSCIRE